VQASLVFFFFLEKEGSFFFFAFLSVFLN